jgi:Skp family chaperone for outer membrane proteins
MGAAPSQPPPPPPPPPVSPFPPWWINAISNASSTPQRKFNEKTDLMSLYHPFPLRMDTPGSGTNIQYDACLQIGEFGTISRDPDRNVFLIPLKVDANPGDGAKFINTLGSKIPAIVGAQPDILLGYPDTDVGLGADWSLAKVLKVNRSFYTWVTSEGTRVIVMAEPILIAGADMEGIKRLPVTPPGDVIHEITSVRYKPAPPIDKRGNPIACPNKLLPVIPLPTNPFKPDIEGTDFTTYLMTPVLILIVILLIWFALKMAVGPAGTFLKSAGDSLGRSLAGGYDALKKVKLPVMPPMPAMPAMPAVPESVRTTRRNLGRVLGVGPTGRTPAPRQTTPTDTPLEEVFPILNPSNEIQITNPMFKDEQMFKDVQAEKADKRRKTMRNRIPRGTIRALTNLPKAPAGTPAAIAEAPAPAGTPAAIAEAPMGETVQVTPRRRSILKEEEDSNEAVSELENIEKEIEDKKKKSLKEAKSRALASNAFKKSVKPPALPPHLRGESTAKSKTQEEVHNESLKRNTSDINPPVQAQPPISAPKPESKPAPPVNWSEMSKPSVEKAPRRLPSLANRRVSVASNTTQATTSSKKSNESHSDRPGWNQRFVSTSDFANWARPMQLSYLRGLKKQNLDTSKFEPFMKKSKGGRRKRRMKTGRRI